MPSNIEQQVMASVGVVHTARRMASATALKVYALVASVYALGALVWVAHIEQNFLQVMNGGVLAVGNFVLGAFVNTSVVVQVVSLVALVAAGSLMADVARTLARPRYAF